MKRLASLAALAAVGLCSTSGATAAPIRTSAVLHRDLTLGAWTNTHTLAVTPYLKSATLTGTLAGTAPLHIAVAIPMQHANEVPGVLWHESHKGDAMYHHYITPATFNSYFAPTPAQAQAVASYLTASGLTNVTVEPNRLFVTADGTAAQVGKAFNTSFATFVQNGRSEFANVSAAQVPLNLQGDVLSVLGLTSLGRLHDYLQVRGHASPVSARAAAVTRRFARSAARNAHGSHRMQACFVPDPLLGSCALATYTINELQALYDETPTPTGANSSIAIFTEGNLAGVQQDYYTAKAHYNLPAPPFIVVPVGPHSVDVSGVGEFDLDTQSSTGMAQTVQGLYVYDAASLNDADVALMFNKFAQRDNEVGGSGSFGECETQAYIDGFTVAGDQSFSEAAMQGQTPMFSTGDNGSFCGVLIALGVPAGLPEQAYPAASLYALGVGGTSLFAKDMTASGGIKDSSSYMGEIAWEGGGGGISVHEAGGWWQQGVVPAAINPPPQSTPVTLEPVQGPTEKGLPDVALNADANLSAIEIIAGGSTTAVGGTSESTPLWLGTWARLETRFGNSLGFAPPVLYNLYKVDATGGSPNTGCALNDPNFPDLACTTQPVGGFRDILFGGNGTFVATPRWDFTTGLGTPDPVAMENLLARLL